LKIYLDTSFLVALWSNEPMTFAAQKWISGQPAENLSISRWCITEFSAAMAGKLQTGSITELERAEALAAFGNAVRRSFSVLEVDQHAFQRAAIFVNQANLQVRSGDALHLAIAAGESLPILTFDLRMQAAAKALGIGVLEV
jgi:predicted nucleic acid-binding protein